MKSKPIFMLVLLIGWGLVLYLVDSMSGLLEKCVACTALCAL